ncbi:MAG: hypothetical protein KGS09_17365 [Nitrospirae bacterium]|nr:hypothetical protein [Nitrospirota bacterium]MDE3042626.1 hypothetical protein [Nitrospirota bacterium]
MANDFTVTRQMIDRLEPWLEHLLNPLLPLQRVRHEDGSFHWEFTEQTPRALQVGKAVRMISGIRAALLLADSGYVVECYSLLRMVSDFAQEIIAIAEALLEERFTEPQERFVRQYYIPIAESADEYEQQERERYVSREELLKAHFRLDEQVTRDATTLRKLMRFVNYTYDKYVHGAYLTSMELYHGDRQNFMLRGHEADLHRRIAKASVAGKLHEVCHSLAFTALAAGDRALSEEITLALNELEKSDEQSMPS